MPLDPSEQHPQARATTSVDAEAPDTALARPLAILVERHGFGRGAVHAMWESVRRGHGAMAQFSHAEFGGDGRWLRGGMIVVGDMFNHALAARVGALCDDLSDLFDGHPEWTAEPPRHLSVQWWPAGLRNPSASGAQNGMRYAWFPRQRRLAIEHEGEVTLYDTEDHHLGGVAQQQGGHAHLSFMSEQGPIEVASLRRVDDTGNGQDTRP